MAKTCVLFTPLLAKSSPATWATMARNGLEPNGTDSGEGLDWAAKVKWWPTGATQQAALA